VFELPVVLPVSAFHPAAVFPVHWYPEHVPPKFSSAACPIAVLKFASLATLSGGWAAPLGSARGDIPDNRMRLRSFRFMCVSYFVL
jgi:hypothetical protein